MAVLNLTDDQVADLIRQLPADQQRSVLLLLATPVQQRRNEGVAEAEAQLRRVSTERGLAWDALSEEEREDFVNDLVHEDRACP